MQAQPRDIITCNNCGSWHSPYYPACLPPKSFKLIEYTYLSIPFNPFILIPGDLVPIETYADWNRAHHCTHAHCPRDCEHPQPFVGDGGTLYCGKCYFEKKIFSEMTPCTPSICEVPVLNTLFPAD